MNENSANQIQLFKSVFKGREDVFAIRWEKADKSGYMPAYHFDSLWCKHPLVPSNSIHYQHQYFINRTYGTKKHFTIFLPICCT